MSTVAMEEFGLMDDPKYRSYVTLVDKTLKAFDNYNEWPDLSAALQKLNKVIKDNQRFPVIPRRIKIGKRLAQCMQQALPAGVHSKALESYDIIFKCMGTNRLSHELFIYSAGLFPLMSYAAITVKPHLLSIFETHFVPLGPRLLPGLSGFLSGVLPGLEVGTDHFDRVNALLEKVCDGVGATPFYCCLWQCVVANAAVRLPAVSFALAHFKKSLSIEDLGSGIEAMIKALCCGMQDINVLVQRTSLDLVLEEFPMHNPQIDSSDMVLLVTAALGTVLRRDITLNRRLYAWLLGSEMNRSILNSDHPFLREIEQSPDLSPSSIYFSMYSKHFLVEGVKATLKEMNADIRLYRLLTSLMDKHDVGPVILDDILFDIFRVLYFTCKTEEMPGSPKRKQEITKSANLFFASLESWYIWQYLGSLFDRACRTNDQQGSKTKPEKLVTPVGSDVPNLWEICEICEFLLGVIPVEANLDTPCEHLMNLLLRLVGLATNYLDSFTPEQLVRCLTVCRTLLKKLQPRRVARQKSDPAEIDGGRVGDIVRPAAIRAVIGKDMPAESDVEIEEPEKIETKIEDTEFGRMLKTFLKNYQAFFVTFVCGGRIINNLFVPRAFEKLKKTSLKKSENYTEELRKLLNTILTEHDESGLNLKRQPSVGEAQDVNLKVADGHIWSECFEIACGILVDASSFPCCFTVGASDLVVLPPWVKTLLVCCCCLEESPLLQISAIRTFLDLSVIVEQKSEDENIKMTTLLEVDQIMSIQKNTNVVKIITQVLWNHLGLLEPQLQVVCITLLHRLLNTFTWDDSVETILGEALLAGDETTRVGSLLRFIKLWTIGREIQDTSQKRCFQSCLLKILDNLLLPDNSPLHLETRSWISEALMRGDIARLLDPLLLILLDPGTARLGILHVSIEPSATAEAPPEEVYDDQNKIYAISSVDGNVIYHVSDSSRQGKNGFPKRLKWRWKKESPGDQRVSMVTSLKGSHDSQLRFITEKNISRNIDLPKSCNGEVSLFINPLNARDDEESLPDVPVSEMIRNARRFNPSTGLVDDTSDSVPRIALRITTEDSSEHEKIILKNKFLVNEEDDPESADEYFSNNTKNDGYRIVHDIMNNLLDAVVRKCESVSIVPGVGVHPLHSHLLLYCGVYDSTRSLYAFNALRNILFTNPRLFLCCAATSGTVNTSFPSDLLLLLAKHRKSVFGRSFEGFLSAANENISAFRSSMYLEVLINVCLYYARSYYPNLGHRLTPEVLAGNRLVQLTSIQILTDVLTELLPLVKESGKGFANYIANILSKCKVQRIVLHCIMSSIISIQQQQHCNNVRIGARTFTEEIIEFNDACEGNVLSEHSRALQVHLIKLILALIKLEHYVENCRSESTDVVNQNQSNKESLSGSTLDARYSPGYLIPQQALFFRAVNSALAMRGSMRGLHSHWTELVTSSLPYLGAALPQIVLMVINQLSVNMEELSLIYSKQKSKEELPPDYALTQLEALSVLCHHCVLDSTQQVSPLSLTANATGILGVSGPNPAQILNNLVHVFTPLPLMQELWKDRNQQLEMLLSVRRSVLSRMPRIIASLSELWTVVRDASNDDIVVWGSPKVVRSQILEFLSPLSVHHGSCFLAAIAVAWHERRDKFSKNVLPIPTADQLVLVQLIGAIKVMPIDTLVQTVHQVLKQPPSVENSLQDMCLEVSVLELFYAYMKTSTGTQLTECWPSLLALLRDGLSLLPPALFLVLAILNEFVQNCTPPFQEKKDQRDLQDITAKLIEACASVAGSCLEQTTWLKRNISVRDFDSYDDALPINQATHLQHSVQAQLFLAQILAVLLDVSYGSQEKEKVSNLLISVMYNITPYLKNHSPRYSGSFQACSQLLANISGFPYTRKGWKKDAFELLLDPSLFQMDEECLPYWITIVDNLMTHDQATFNDLMSRISVAQSGSYNLFSSREQEYEQRAQLLKRLAFVIMCSETKQYQKSFNQIQERLTESLRLPQVVPSIQAQVFFCFRVLLLRMPPSHIASLWPIIISEMVQVFMHIELELMADTEEFSTHIRHMATLDSSWVVNSSNGLNAHGHPHWLLLTTAAAKLLDLVVLLPAHHLPQFQMYRWAFVGDSPEMGQREESSSSDFVPHVKRICNLMDNKYGECTMFVRPKEGRLLLTDQHVDSLQQLHSFFHSLQKRPKSNDVDMVAVEKHILRDFLEKLPTSPVH